MSMYDCAVCGEHRCHHVIYEFGQQRARIKKLQSKLNKAIAALEFYSDYGNHVMPKDAPTNLTSIDVDGGTVAAKCLEGINNKEA